MAKTTAKRTKTKRTKRRKTAGPGRPTRYSAGMAAQALKLCEAHGYDEARLAKAFGVGRTTLRDWIKRYPALKKSVELGQEYYDTNNTVLSEKALLAKATGKVKVVTKVVETAPITCKDGPCYGPDGQLLMGTTTRTVTAGQAPDTAAIKYLLNNRAAHRYADKPAGDNGKPEALTFTMHLHAPEPRKVAANG